MAGTNSRPVVPVFGVPILRAFFVERQGEVQRDSRWYSYARLTEDEFNQEIPRAELQFGVVQPIEQDIVDAWNTYGTDWADSLRVANNPINYDKYSRRIEQPCVVELAQIWRFTVITVRDNPGIGQGAFFALISAEFPRTPYDLVNLFTWIIESNTAGNTWAELRQLILDNIGNFDLSTWPYPFVGEPRPF